MDHCHLSFSLFSREWVVKWLKGSHLGYRWVLRDETFGNVSRITGVRGTLRNGRQLSAFVGAPAAKRGFGLAVSLFLGESFSLSPVEQEARQLIRANSNQTLN